MDRKIFLSSYDSKKSVNTSNGLNVELKGNRKLLPLDDVGEVISQYDQYKEERTNCNKIRLTCQINTLASNVLFNKVTEIVKREGSNDVVNVNYGIGSNEEFNSVVYKDKTMNFWSGGAMKYQSTDNKISELGNNRAEPISVITNDTRHNTGGTLSSTINHPTNAIRDTQLSNNDENNEHFVYHCGLDFLNNHLIRSNTFRMVCKMPDGVDKNYSAFNTIADLMRDVTGHKICEKYYFPTNANVPSGTKYIAMHLYDVDKIDTFEEAVENKLIYKYNGWVGFENASKIKSYSDFSGNTELNIERPLMYYNSGDFVDMYPSRDLFSFVPKYNKYQDRIEKNWNYCITYPSSSFTPSTDTDQFSDIIESNDGVNSLKAVFFDENTRSDNGTTQLVIYSIARHGLNVGDYVNIYKTYTINLYWVTANGDRVTEKFENEIEATDAMTILQHDYPKDADGNVISYSVESQNNVTVTRRIIDNAEVSEIVDPYIFTTYGSDIQISKYWFYLSDIDLSHENITAKTNDGNDEDVIYSIDSSSRKFYRRDGSPFNYYIINNEYVNLDDNAQRISYKKVVGDIECEYYIRIFSKLPNFKFASASTNNEYEIYKNSGETISTYQAKEYEFENHLSRLAFAKNIYGDDIAEIVFTDDIDLSYLKDNLGRPLSSLYLTVIKNNQGYKEWYGCDSKGNWTTSVIQKHFKDIEFSHCFGKITCGIDTSDESIHDNRIMSIKRINNVDSINGYNISKINGGNERDELYRSNNFELNRLEVSYDTDKHFYGDLCYYDAYNAIERPIQQILHRFNTAQRECFASKSNNYYLNFIYDEIENDDYDVGNMFLIHANYAANEGDNLCSFREGYYYEPHYEIPIRVFDKAKTIMPDFLTIRGISRKSESTYEIVTLQKHFLKMGDKAMLYDRINEKYYILKTVKNISDNVFVCISYLDSDDETPCDIVKGESETILYSLTPKDSLYASFKLFKMDNLDVPDYARVLKDGTCRIIWRDLLNNGDGIHKDEIEEYPFTNGAFYINKKIDIYVRRQDPYGEYGLCSEYDVNGNEMDISAENNYIKDDEIVC